MNIQNRIIAITLMASVFILAIAGCSHSTTTTNSGSIVGIWNIYKIRQVHYTNGVAVLDTTNNLPAGYITTTFTSDGRAIDGGSAGAPDTTNYTLTGSSLHITNNGSMYGTYETVLTLDAHNLVITWTDHDFANHTDSAQWTYTGSR